MKSSAPKLLLTSVVMLASSFLLAGCLESKVDSYPTDSTTSEIDQKQGDTSLTGTITKTGEQYTLVIVGQPPKSLDSYKIDLSQYAGQKVTVTGQYSGDTLFVSLVE